MELYNFIQLSTDKLSENGILDFNPKKAFLAFCERISAAIFNFPLQLKVKPRYLYSLTVSNISWEYKNYSFSSFLIFLREGELNKGLYEYCTCKKKSSHMVGKNLILVL